MADESKSQEEDVLQGVDGFCVKGKPSINLTPTQSAGLSHLGTLLKQKVEELQQAQSKEHKILATTVGAEFKPENMPYIPGSTHPALLKHDLATIERNAGYQDRALVPPMYADQMKSKEPPIDLSPKSVTDMESNIEILISEIECATVSQVYPSTVSQVQPVTQGVQPEFEMKVHRDKMHHGGHYFFNESRPYKPGG
jgi:hypothetical protein